MQQPDSVPENRPTISMNTGDVTDGNKISMIKNEQIPAQSEHAAPSNNQAAILHLSDLHFEADKQANSCYSQLADDLRYELDCTRLDLLILSGDITNSSTPEEYAAAQCFLDKLRQEFQLAPERIVIAPGNHDLNWQLAKQAYKVERRESYAGPFDDTVIDNGNYVEVRNETAYQQRFQHFSAFYQSVTGRSYPPDCAEQAVLRHYPEFKLLVMELNSAWQLDHHYTSRAAIHPGALSTALSRIRREPGFQDCLKLAVWHHPLQSDSEDRISDHGFMQRLAQAGFSLALHGHIHKAENHLYRYDQNPAGRRLHLVCAGTFGAPAHEWTPGYPLQYNLLQLQGNTLTVQTRRREEINGAWKPDARWLEGAGQNPLPYYQLSLFTPSATEILEAPASISPPPQKSPAASLHAVADEAFDGQVQLLDEQLLSHHADARRTRQFYQGAPLDWDIIAAGADIARDQHDEILALLRAPAAGLRLCCIVAEPGAGKSTLAWHLAAELCQNHQALVLRATGREEVWYRLPKFCRQVTQPLYLLVDDLFREPEVSGAVCELSRALPVTILATARANEYHPRRFKGDIQRIDLQPPAPTEKERILQHLGQTRAALTSARRQRLDAVNQFLVLMLELTAGKDLAEIIEDTVTRLEQQDEAVYRAYEYLCFAYQYSVSLPVSLLEQLDVQGRFYHLPERKTAQGLIFYTDERGKLVHAGHPLLAEQSYAFYARYKRPPVAVLRELAEAADVSVFDDRNFITVLFHTLARTDAGLARQALPQIQEKLEQVKQSATITEMFAWQAVYRLLKQDKEAERCVQLVLTFQPLTSTECSLLIHLYRQCKRERDALPVFEQWIQICPEFSHCLQIYLGLAERYGSPQQISRVLEETADWLARHPDDNCVRTTYLGLAERKGRPEQVARVLEETVDWLARHPEDSNVRIVYLGLTERKGCPEDVARVLEETAEWLTQHPEDYEVRRNYLGLAERKGRPEDVARVLEKTAEWLTQHPEDCKVRKNYLGLVERKGSPEQVAQVLEETAEWLEHIPNKTPNDFNLSYSYGRLLLNSEQFANAGIQFRKVLKRHKGHAMARNGLARALCGLGRQARQQGKPKQAENYFAEAEREFRQTLYWAKKNGDSQAIFHTHLGWLLIELGRNKKALFSFQVAMRENADYFGNYHGMGKALMGLRRYAEAEQALLTARTIAADALKPPASEEIHALLEECRRELDKQPEQTA
ncbi:MAG: hypothetical protein GY862_13870 [Gammaproteobacteria bacterium]|nr:hypothetical protein [Gammaproteobacteria bacterium]